MMTCTRHIEGENENHFLITHLSKISICTVKIAPSSDCNGNTCSNYELCLHPLIHVAHRTEVRVRMAALDLLLYVHKYHKYGKRMGDL